VKPIKQMRMELGVKAIPEENERIADRRRKRTAKLALDRETELQLVPGTPSTRGPFYSNRAMRRAGLGAGTTMRQFAEASETPSTVKAYGIGDMIRAVRGLRRKTG